MARPLLHVDTEEVDRMVGHTIMGENQFPMITDAEIVAATNTAGLKLIVDAYKGHSESEGFKPGIKRVLDIGNATGSLSDTNVQAATTAATLAANTYSDPSKVWPLDPV